MWSTRLVFLCRREKCAGVIVMMKNRVMSPIGDMGFTMVAILGPLSIVPHCIAVLYNNKILTSVFDSILICETLNISAFLPVSRYIGVSGVCSFNLATRFHLQVYLLTSKGECQSIYHRIIIAILQGH